MKEFFIYYVRGRVYEWTFAISMFFAGLELLMWDEVLMFGAFHWLLEILSQKVIGLLLLAVGWLRISSLMFNGQLLFGKRVGMITRGACAVMSAAIWAQFALALLQLSLNQGPPSLGLPFWTMFVVAELVIAYQIGAEWKK